MSLDTTCKHTLLAVEPESHDTPPARQRPMEHQAVTSAKAGPQSVQEQLMLKPRASLARQPSEFQDLIRDHAMLWYHGAGITKAGLSRRLQLEIQYRNLSRPRDDQLKIPSLKTISLFIDVYLDAALCHGLTAKRSIAKKILGVSSETLNQKATLATKLLPPEFEQ